MYAFECLTPANQATYQKPEHVQSYTDLLLCRPITAAKKSVKCSINIKRG